MKKYDFDWSKFTEQDFANYCAMVENEQLLADDYVGCVRVGDLCFDLVLRCYEPVDDRAQLFLTYDLYVGGIDNGYGVSRLDHEYPYDFAEGDDFNDTCISMTYEDFKTVAEKSFTKYLENCAYTESHSLVSKAEQPLHIW